MTCSRCHRLVGITWDERSKPCVVTSIHWDWGNLVNDEGGIESYSECKCASVPRALSIKYKSWFPQLMCVHREATQGGAFQAGFCCIIFSGIFSLVLYCMLLSPPLAARRQRKSCWRKATISGSYLAVMKKVHPKLPTALWFDDVMPF